MKNAILLLPAITLFSVFHWANAQGWEKTFGGGSPELGTSIQQTSNGGYIITGYTFSSSGNGGYDVYLIRTDANGAALWEKTFGGINHEGGRSVKQTW